MPIERIIGFALMALFFGLCIFVHELGHLLAGLWRKLHVECFSVGFGQAIWKKVYKGVEYRLGWLPLGGYVALPQLEPSDEPETFAGEKLPQAKPMDRIITAFAGPFFNILFALALGSIIYVVGIERPQTAPDGSIRVAKVHKNFQNIKTGKDYTGEDGQVYQTPEWGKLQPWDRITSINGTPTDGNIERLTREIMFSPGGMAQMDVIRNENPIKVEYKIQSHPDPLLRGTPLPQFTTAYPVMIHAFHRPPNGDASGAEEAGLQKKDRVLEVNGREILNQDDFIKTLRDLNPNPQSGTVLVGASIKVEREAPDGTLQELVFENIQPKLYEESNAKGESTFKAYFGIQVGMPMVPYKPTPWSQFITNLSMTGKTLAAIFDPGNPLGFKAMSSFIGIGNVMQKQFSGGIKAAAQEKTMEQRIKALIPSLRMVVMISFGLAFFNLLPLPVLDGGHITMALIEIVARRRVPARIIQPISYGFIALLLSFVVYVSYYDVAQIVRGFGGESPQAAEAEAESTAPAATQATEDAQDESKESAQ